MTKWKINGYTFNLNDDDLDINFDVDSQSGLVEISASDNSGYSNRMYINREAAMVFALWLKSGLSE